MKIGFCNDHAGFVFKTRLARLLASKGYEIVDFGTDSTVSVDYPGFAHKLASAVENGEVDLGIALCGTGNGMAMTLNHHKGIRAGLAWNSEVGRLVKAHKMPTCWCCPQGSSLTRWPPASSTPGCRPSSRAAVTFAG